MTTMGRKLFWMAAISAFAMLSSRATARTGRQPAATVVDIQQGSLKGVSTEGVTSWKGIPFAAPPVGALRWRAPQPVKPWKGVHGAAAYGADCMQFIYPTDAAPLTTEPSEDCLYANVWRPAGGGRKLPVLVWIYGGGFVNGGTSPAVYSGAELAKQGVLFVSFNYRLGRFGTFAHPALLKANEDRGLIGNYGFLDQIAALKWVKRNIASFGGDPANVTIIGESAGGMSVHNLVTSPMGKGLFERAVVLSGGDGNNMAGIDGAKPDLAAVEAIGVRFAKAHGIADNGPDALAKLRALSSEEVTDRLNLDTLFNPPPGEPTFSAPFVDGRIAVNQVQAYTSGRFTPVPMLIGSTAEEIGGIKGFMTAGARRLAANIAGHGAPVWEYRFSYVATSSGQEGRAWHASDIPYFLNTQAAKYGAGTSARDSAMGRVMSGYIVNFARTGNPNGHDLPLWQRHSATDPVAIMDFAPDGTAKYGADPWYAQIMAAMPDAH